MTREELGKLAVYIANKIQIHVGDTVTVTCTTEEEILIYWKENDSFYNILIDEDWMAELLYIPKDRSRTRNKFINLSLDLSVETIISEFNELIKQGDGKYLKRLIKKK